MVGARNFDIRVLIACSLLIYACVGCRSESNSPPETHDRFRVSGPSMNPTLWDVSFRTTCPNCGIPIRIDGSLWERALATDRAKCWHCGDRLDLANADFARLPPDEVRLIETPIETLKPGDLVLLRHPVDGQSSAVHVKRIIAVPGQTISIDEERRLLVDDQLPQFPTIPKLLVDSGRHRPDSRWHPIGDRWWRYEHRLVHRGHRPGPILDDYPGNIAIDRMLYPVASISVKASTAEIPEPLDKPDTIEEICLWGHLDSRDHPKLESLGLSEQRPIAVRLHDQSDPNKIASALELLSVYRDVVYHANGPDSKAFLDTYPITLASDEFFVVGDNVPLSLDSRSWGPIQRDELIGLVVPKRGSTRSDLNHSN